jgi:hypothetical protein
MGMASLPGAGSAFSFKGKPMERILSGSQIRVQYKNQGVFCQAYSRTYPKAESAPSILSKISMPLFFFIDKPDSCHYVDSKIIIIIIDSIKY